MSFWPAVCYLPWKKGRKEKPLVDPSMNGTGLPRVLFIGTLRSSQNRLFWLSQSLGRVSCSASEECPTKKREFLLLFSKRNSSRLLLFLDVFLHGMEVFIHETGSSLITWWDSYLWATAFGVSILHMVIHRVKSRPLLGRRPRYSLSYWCHLCGNVHASVLEFKQNREIEGN